MPLNKCSHWHSDILIRGALFWAIQYRNASIFTGKDNHLSSSPTPPPTSPLSSPTPPPLPPPTPLPLLSHSPLTTPTLPLPRSSALVPLSTHSSPPPPLTPRLHPLPLSTHPLSTHPLHLTMDNNSAVNKSHAKIVIFLNQSTLLCLKDGLHRKLLYSCLIVFPVLTYVKFYIDELDTALGQLGLICSCCSVVMYGSPLSTVVSICQTCSWMLLCMSMSVSLELAVDL